MTENEDILTEIRARMDENQELLREIARWSRFQNMGKLKDVLATELDTDEKKLAFESTDDKKGINEVAQACGAPRDTVYSWWKKWFRLGILEPSKSRQGRLVRICSLEDVGIKIPKTVHHEEKTAVAKVTTTQEVPKDKTAETKETPDQKSSEEVPK